MPEPVSDMNYNQELGYFCGSNHFFSNGNDDLIDINLRNLENLSLLDNFCGVNGIPGAETNDSLVYFHDLEPVLSPYIDDLKEGNISRTVRVPSSEHVAEIVGRQGCKIKDLRARTNTYIKTPMRTQSPVFVVTGKEEAVLHVIEEIQNAAEHFTHIRACRNQKAATGQEMNRPISREGDVTIQVTVPYRVVGLVVGLKGQTIKAIQQDTDTFIVTPNRDKAPIFEVRGQPENVEKAKIQILRHIETRTRNCRPQDINTVPSIWTDDKRQYWNSFPFYRSETLPQNSLSSNNMSIHCNFSNETALSGVDFFSPASDFNKICSAISPPTHNSYIWRDQPPSETDHLTPWNKATHDHSGFLNLSLSSLVNSFTDSPSSSTRDHYAMSSGSATSSCNSSASISPPNDYLECSFPSQRTSTPYEASTNQVSLGSFNNETEALALASFPLFSRTEPTSCKRSLVLGSLFESRDSISSNVNEGSLQEDKQGQFHSFTSSSNESLLPSIPCSLHDGASDAMVQRDGFQRSGPGSTSKNGSHIVAPGCSSSPTPRICYICQEACVVAALVPCGHNLFCMECAEAIVNKTEESDRKCPACQEIVGDVLRIRG